MSRLTQTCALEGCQRFGRVTRGLCYMHYARLRRLGATGDATAKYGSHGMWGTRTYRIWKAMRTRCNNPNTKFWRNYGGRGIKVCPRWDSFEAFYEDMGACPDGLSIERKNSNGDYEPSNCCWATRKQQTLNRRGFGASKFKGVHHTSGRSDWRAAITPTRGRIITLGFYDNEHEAALAWNLAAWLVYGHDAHLNEIIMLPSGMEKPAV